MNIDVTHRALSKLHWQATRAQAALPSHSVVLFIQETSELDFTHHTQTQELGPIGVMNDRGFMLHSTLAACPTGDNPQILGC